MNRHSSNLSLFLVEDDEELAQMVADFLRAEAFDVETERDGLRAVERALSAPFDAVILDIGLPGLDGISVCRRIRSRFTGVILMLTARGDEIDEVISLEVGADDYMTKPVRPRALLSRLRLHLRRQQPDRPDSLTPFEQALEVNGLKIDPANRRVFICEPTSPSVEGSELLETEIELTTAEFDLLWFLAQRAGSVVSRQEIYLDVQGIPYDGLDRSIDLRVSRLRKKLNDDPACPERIKSVRGVGYLLTVS